VFSKRYLKAGGDPDMRNKSRQDEGEAAIWQRRYWEHPIRVNVGFKKTSPTYMLQHFNKLSIDN